MSRAPRTPKLPESALSAATKPLGDGTDLPNIPLLDDATDLHQSEAKPTWRGSLLLFGISAVYHRFNWSPHVKAVFRRLDHSNIFLLIAGTYTPLAINALPYPKSVILLAIIWTGALLGIAFRIFWLKAPRILYVALYIALGWAAMLYIVDLVNANVAMMVLVVVGGVSYTVGAVFYALKRPNPVPGVFGFHEIFHSCTVIAFLCHWTAILLIVLNPVTS